MGIIGYTQGVRLVARPAPKRTAIAISGCSRRVASRPVTRWVCNTSPRPGSGRVHAVAAGHVVLENLEELGYDRVTLQREHEPAVDIDRRFRLLEGAGE